eukprot:5092739-Pleurochrysis_carterae.AAC.1
MSYSSQRAIEVVVGKVVIAEVVLGLLASIHHEPGGCGARYILRSTDLVGISHRPFSRLPLLKA